MMEVIYLQHVYGKPNAQQLQKPRFTTDKPSFSTDTLNFLIDKQGFYQ